MRRVALESPYAAPTAALVERNLRYLRAAMLDCFTRGEAPFASHGLYTQPHVLDDSKVEERRLGIEAGQEWAKMAEVRVVYTDLGFSRGMVEGIIRAKDAGQELLFRDLGADWDKYAPPPEPQQADPRDEVLRRAVALVERLDDHNDESGVIPSTEPLRQALKRAGLECRFNSYPENSLAS